MKSTIMYPAVSKNNLIMKIKKINSETNLPERYLESPTVRAAGVLGSESSTEIIDVNKLSRRNSSIIQYVEIADAEGRLYCVDGIMSASCWLKIVSLAKDCHSSNVVLMFTGKGVVLKTIRIISPGEPLVMWFTETVLAMLNMPFLTPSNIQELLSGQNRYICHKCNNRFEYPNPLKIHLALKCNRLNANHLWTELAKAVSSSPNTNLSLSIYPQSTFTFELSNFPMTSSNRSSPILVETRDSLPSPTNNSPVSSNRPSPTSSNQPSPNSSTQVSPSSSTPVSPVRKNLGQIQSAFKPYINQSNLFPVSPPQREETALIPYKVQTNEESIATDVHAAQMETIVSNLGKSKQGHLCIYCGKVYSRKYGLKIHIRTHTGYKPLKCKFCNRPFGDPSNLNKHVRLHADGETPYRCELCGKVLVRRRDLERHMRSRHQADVDESSDSSSGEIDV